MKYLVLFFLILNLSYAQTKNDIIIKLESIKNKIINEAFPVSNIDSLLSWGKTDTTDLLWNAGIYKGRKLIGQKYENWNYPDDDTTIGFWFRWYYGKKKLEENEIPVLNPVFIGNFSDQTTWEPFPEVNDGNLTTYKEWTKGYFVADLPRDYYVDSVLIWHDNIGDPITLYLKNSIENFGKDKDYETMWESPFTYIPAHNPISHLNFGTQTIPGVTWRIYEIKVYGKK